MFRHGAALVTDGAREADGPAPGASPRRPNLAGDLDSLLGTRPLFRTALRGYDRLQVDNYVSWAEAELQAVRRENDDLLTRYGACSAEVEISRRLLACSPEGRELVRTSERVGEILRLAADEAAQLTEAGAVEADRIRGQARSEADALLRRAAEVKDTAITVSRRMEEEARWARADSQALVVEAREEAARIRAEAQAAAARAVADAEAERDRVAAEARAALQRLTGQLDDALGSLAALLAGQATVAVGEPLAS
ncbi:MULTISPECIES: DivIVA domain-containing protein [unclassified Geodermatophilus]|uniref:DivIVA domain-containing protein n=1 Tax=unclassified Geodermatophilus TaxID=2637632 RepID=UPI003EE9A632